MSMDGKKLAELFDSKKKIKNGTLKFWGVWFGRPYDNVHTITSILYEENKDLLTLRFDNDETLFVFGAKEIKADSKTFRIKTASQVRWEWFFYERPKVKANLYFMNFEKNADAITYTTNLDWYKDEQKPSGKEPAVEML